MLSDSLKEWEVLTTFHVILVQTKSFIWAALSWWVFLKKVSRIWLWYSTRSIDAFRIRFSASRKLMLIKHIPSNIHLRLLAFANKLSDLLALLDLQLSNKFLHFKKRAKSSSPFRYKLFKTRLKTKLLIFWIMMAQSKKTDKSKSRIKLLNWSKINSLWLLSMSYWRMKVSWKKNMTKDSWLCSLISKKLHSKIQIKS